MLLTSGPGAGPVRVLSAVDPDTAKPGLVGFLVVMAMAVALFFLLRSLAKHLRRVDVDRDAREAEGEEPSPPDTEDGHGG